MPDSTSYLGLILPGFDEYTDSWNEPVNQNTVLIDTAIKNIATEVIAARQSKASLLAFLQVAHNSDGSLLAAPEVVRARVSPVYGFKSSGTALPLKSRLDSLDYELYLARRGQATLSDSLSFARAGLKDMVLSGAVDNSGAPAWLGSTGATAKVDGGVTPLFFLINGFVARVRTLKSVTLSGASGTHYLLATYASGGTVNVDGTGVPNGQTSVDGSGDMTLFTDTVINFAQADVQPGDLLTLTTSGDAGQYVIGAVAPGGVQTQLQIIGTFPVGGLSSIAYTVKDPLGVTLTQATVPTAATGQLVVGEADFDGAAVTAVRPRNFKDTYNSPWRFFDLSTTANHEEVFNHYLGSDLLDVEIHVSQASDGTASVETLSTADLQQNTAVTVTDGKTVTIANTLTFSAGSSGATLTGGAVPLSQAVTGSLGGTISALAGAVTPTRSVAVKWDRNRISVRNVTPSLLYKDYDGSQHQTGYVRVVVRKRG